jgi:uncharacterized protein (DUF4415 family)
MYRDDWERTNDMTDKDIDYSDIPPLTDAQLAAMKPLREVLPRAVRNKVRITIRLDADTVRWFKEQVEQAGGGSYQSFINDALRDYIEHQREPLEDVLRQVLREELQEIKAHLAQSTL